MVQILKIFAEPSKYDLYKVIKHILANWTDVSGQAEGALEELAQGKCARSGFRFGKLFMQLIESDEYLTSVVWKSAQNIVNSVGSATKKAYDKVSSMFTEL